MEGKFNNPDFQKAKENFSDEQNAAIRRGVIWGKEIQEKFPQVAIDYMNGMTGKEIVEKYNLKGALGINNAPLAENSLKRALFGYKGEFKQQDLAPYPGLIADQDIKKLLEKKHRQANGIRARNEKKGMFGLSRDERSQIGKKVGIRIKESGKGIFAYSPQERKAVSKSAVIASGRTPLSEQERQFMIDAASNPEYSQGKRVNTQKIAEEMNRRFHAGTNKRNSRTVSTLLYALKK